MPNYLSTDPNAGTAVADGKYLSTDPNAGVPFTGSATLPTAEGETSPAEAYGSGTPLFPSTPGGAFDPNTYGTDISGQVEQALKTTQGQALEKASAAVYGPGKAIAETAKGFVTGLPQAVAQVGRFAAEPGKTVMEALPGTVEQMQQVRKSDPFSQEWWNAVVPLVAQEAMGAAGVKGSAPKPAELDKPPVQEPGVPENAPGSPVARPDEVPATPTPPVVDNARIAELHNRYNDLQGLIDREKAAPEPDLGRVKRLQDQQILDWIERQGIEQGTGIPEEQWTQQQQPSPELGKTTPETIGSPEAATSGQLPKPPSQPSETISAPEQGKTEAPSYAESTPKEQPPASGAASGELVGAANRVAAAREKAGLLGEEGAPESGTGVGYQESVAEGNAAIDSGTDPYAVASKFQRDGLISRQTMGVMRAQMERLQEDNVRAQDAVRKVPNDPGLVKAAQDAQDAENAFWRAYQPMKTEWSNVGTGMQEARGISNIDLLDESRAQAAMRENLNRELKPMERAQAIRASRDAQAATGAAHQAFDRAVNEASRRAKGPVRDVATLARDLADKLKEITC